MPTTASPVRRPADLARGTDAAELDVWFVGSDGREAHRAARPADAARSPEPSQLAGAGNLRSRCRAGATTMRASADLARCPDCSA